MANTRTVGNPLALAVLAYLKESPRHPYELGKLLKERDIGESIKYRHSSLYMVVEQLSRDGYIEAQETTRDGQRPERTVYRLTAAGDAQLLERMRALVAVPTKEYRQFEAALALIVVLPRDEVVELLARRQQALAEQAERERAAIRRATGPDRLFVVEYEYRLELVRAEQRFVKRLAKLVEEGSDGIAELWQRLHESATSGAAER